jgi:DNA-binding beta-propeller fold protein YncE
VKPFRIIVIVSCLVVVAGVARARLDDEGPDAACPAPTGRLAFPDPRPEARHQGMALVANQFSDDATLVNLATGIVKHLDTGDGPHDAAVSPDGRWGAVSNFDPMRGGRMLGNRLFVIDMARGVVVRTIETGDLNGLHELAFRPGFPTRVLVTAQTSRRLLEIDIVTGEIVAAMDTDGERSHTLTVSRDGSTAWTTNEGTADISRIDLVNRSLVVKFPASTNIEGIALAMGDRELWVGEPGERAVKVRDAGTGRILATLPGFKYPVRIVATDDGRRVVISDPGCRIVAIADAERRAVTSVLDGSDLRAFVGHVDADGRTAYASSKGMLRGKLLVIDLETGSILAEHDAGRGADGIGRGPSR